MDCSPRDSGYATVAATGLSLVIAMVAAGLMAVANAELSSARADHARVRNAALLEGEHLVAAHRLVRSGPGDRLAWDQDTASGRVSVLAEREGAKLALRRSADALDDHALRALDAEPERARSLLRSAALEPRTARVRLLRASPSPMWRRCILSLVSPLGGAERASLGPPEAPAGSQANWRTGEVWRIRIVSAEGWADDRLVRWTADERRPAATIDRAFERADPGEVPCDTSVR